MKHEDIEAKLFEDLGIVRMIGQIQPEGEQEELLKVLESTIWSARAAEGIIEDMLDKIAE